MKLKVLLTIVLSLLAVQAQAKLNAAFYDKLVTGSGFKFMGESNNVLTYVCPDGTVFLSLGFQINRDHSLMLLFNENNYNQEWARKGLYLNYAATQVGMGKDTILDPKHYMRKLCNLIDVLITNLSHSNKTIFPLDDMYVHAQRRSDNIIGIMMVPR